MRRIRAKAWLVALLAVAGAGATFQGGGGYEQNAHYALVRALGSGTLTIDKTRGETGSLATGDLVRNKGHIYSNKPPGMAFVVLPAYVAMKAAGIDTLSDPSRTLWVLGLFGVVLPFFVLMLLVRWVVERIEPGWGTAAAVVLGLGTSLLPFAALFWAHILAACLLFACFAVLFRERQGPASLLLVGAAGVLAGYAFGTEIQAAETGVVLGVYALVRRPILSRGLAFAGGGLLGALPFLAYTWALWGKLTFGWVGRADGLGLHHGINHIAVHHVAANGLGVPSRHSAWMVLFSSRGIFAISPVLACGFVGLVLLARSRFRTEGIVCLVVVGLQLLFDFGYYTHSISAAFGGFQITSRYLIPTVPFLAVGSALVMRRWPYAVLGLFVVSAAIVAAATMTYPGSGYDGHWLQRLRDGTISPLGWKGVPDWRAAVPFVFFVAVAVAATWLTLPRVVTTVRALVAGVVPLVVWGIYALLTTSPWPQRQGVANGLDAFAVLAFCCAALLGLTTLYARRARTAT